MLNKLALSGIKNRFKDYIVLFLGLVISSAIFYMFEALATNKAFIDANGTAIKSASMIFEVGSVLLTIITLVYIFYANSFLMSMRSHDYGLFIMLGARQSKIGRLILAETIVIGVISSVIGIIVGWLVTASLGNFLMTTLLHTHLKNFQAFYAPAMIVTIVLYLGLFLIAGIINRRAIMNRPVLSLLKGEEQPNAPKLKPALQFMEMIAGVILLAAGYAAIVNFRTLQFASVWIGFITITLGTYLFFNAVFIWLVTMLKKTKWASKSLNNFTLSQLSFRIKSYTKILTITAMLFALALGAITVGMGLKNQINYMSKLSSPYSMQIFNPSEQTKAAVNRLAVQTKVTYSQKVVGNNIYYNESELIKNPLQEVNMAEWAKNGQNTGDVKYHNIALNDLKKDNFKLLQLAPRDQQDKNAEIVSDAQFNQIAGPVNTIMVFRVKDLTAVQPQLQKIANMAYPDVKNQEDVMTKVDGGYATMLTFRVVYGGFEFMGFFLGIAFLAMLASCLMFKILSGAVSDKRRYTMLNKIGVRSNVLKRSIRREILTLFALPGLLGIVHVLFGLQLFEVLMPNPYTGIWVPFIIFLVLYGGYYLITVTIYEKIVIPKIKIDK